MLGEGSSTLFIRSPAASSGIRRSFSLSQHSLTFSKVLRRDLSNSNRPGMFHSRNSGCKWNIVGKWEVAASVVLVWEL